MKLNRKFSFIILFTIVQSCVLTVFSIINLKSIQNIKDYQNMETKTEAQLSTIIDYLERMDYWDFDIGNAYSAFEEKKVEISKSFAYLTENSIVNEFPEDFKTCIIKIEKDAKSSSGISYYEYCVKEDENFKFRSFLKGHADEEELDKQFLRLHKELFADYDCSKCRNCCKMYKGSIHEEDLEKDAEYLGITVE